MFVVYKLMYKVHYQYVVLKNVKDKNKTQVCAYSFEFICPVVNTPFDVKSNSVRWHRFWKVISIKTKKSSNQPILFNMFFFKLTIDYQPRLPPCNA